MLNWIRDAKQKIRGWHIFFSFLEMKSYDTLINYYIILFKKIRPFALYFSSYRVSRSGGATCKKEKFLGNNFVYKF